MLTRGEKKLLSIQGLSFFSSSLAGIFTQFFVFKYLNFSGLVLYDFILLIFLLLLYIASGYLLKQFTTRNLIQCSLVLTTISYALLFIFRENALRYIVLLGILDGISAGLYWSGYNLSQYILTHAATRDHFFGRAQAVINFASAIAPLLGGLIVSVSGFYTLFAVVTGINLYLSFVAKDLPEHSGIVFSLRHFLTHVRTRKWIQVLQQNFVLGLYDAGFNILSGVIFFLVLKDASVVGLTRSIIFLISALSGMIAGKVLLKTSYVPLLAGIVTAIGIVIFGLYQTPMGIMMFGLLTGTFVPLMNVVFSSNVLNAIDEKKESWQHKYEMFIERDAVLGIARILSMFVLLVLFTRYEKSDVAANYIVGIAVLPLVLGLMMYRFRKQV